MSICSARRIDFVLVGSMLVMWCTALGINGAIGNPSMTGRSTDLRWIAPEMKDESVPKRFGVTVIICQLDFALANQLFAVDFWKCCFALQNVACEPDVLGVMDIERMFDGQHLKSVVDHLKTGDVYSHFDCVYHAAFDYKGRGSLLTCWLGQVNC